MTVGMWRSTHVIFNLVKKLLVLVKNEPKRLYGWEKLLMSIIFSPFWGLFIVSGTNIGFKSVLIYKIFFGFWRSTHVAFVLVQKALVLVKKYPKRKEEKIITKYIYFFVLKKGFKLKKIATGLVVNHHNDCFRFCLTNYVLWAREIKQTNHSSILRSNKGALLSTAPVPKKLLPEVSSWFSIQWILQVQLFQTTKLV